MARKGTRSRRYSSRSVSDLEEFLQIGECLSCTDKSAGQIANRTERLPAENIITLEVTDEAGDRTAKASRLTRESVASVERCLGRGPVEKP